MTDKSAFESGEFRCENCGMGFDPYRRQQRFCSRRCRSQSVQRAPKYKLYNQNRISWLQSVWYGNGDLFGTIDGKNKGHAFELLASESILPRLGFEHTVHLAEIAQNAPFDFIARLDGKKAFVDITTKWQKRVEWKARFAATLEIPLFILHVSPRDPAFFDLVSVAAEARSVRVSISVIRAIAKKYGESDGR